MFCQCKMDWFDTDAGVKEVDQSSHTMLGIFINDIDDDVKSVNTGIVIDDHNICILLYADCITELQILLDDVHQWSLKCKIKFNAKISNILYVRQPHILLERTSILH